MSRGNIINGSVGLYNKNNRFIDKNTGESTTESIN